MPDLYPVIDVSVAVKTKAVIACCRFTGYYEGTEDEPVYDHTQWTDSAAMLAHWNEHCSDPWKTIYRNQQRADAAGDIVVGDLTDEP